LSYKVCKPNHGYICIKLLMFLLVKAFHFLYKFLCVRYPHYPTLFLKYDVQAEELLFSQFSLYQKILFVRPFLGTSIIFYFSVYKRWNFYTFYAIFIGLWLKPLVYKGYCPFNGIRTHDIVCESHLGTH